MIPYHIICMGFPINPAAADFQVAFMSERTIYASFAAALIPDGI